MAIHDVGQMAQEVLPDVETVEFLEEAKQGVEKFIESRVEAARYQRHSVVSYLDMLAKTKELDTLDKVIESAEFLTKGREDAQATIAAIGCRALQRVQAAGQDPDDMGGAHGGGGSCRSYCPMCGHFRQGKVAGGRCSVDSGNNREMLRDAGLCMGNIVVQALSHPAQCRSGTRGIGTQVREVAQKKHDLAVAASQYVKKNMARRA